jgi:hypothetical protein
MELDERILSVKKKFKKLNLNKETLRSLEEEAELKNAAGGLTATRICTFCTICSDCC